jgi:hypothetical protein
MDEWDGKVPLLGFDGEHHEDQTWSDGKRILYIPVKNYGAIIVYAWSPKNSEGYNIFWPNDKLPIQQPIGQARSPFDAKMLIQAYLNRLDHYIKTGEDHGYEVLSSSARSEA